LALLARAAWLDEGFWKNERFLVEGVVSDLSSQFQR
jgi:hypothetical protein